MIWILVIELLFAEGNVILRADAGHFTQAACKLEVERLAVAMMHININWRMTCEAFAVEREV